MAESAFSGPIITPGAMTGIPSGFSGGVTAVPSGESLVGPNGFYQGYGILDPRFVFPESKSAGFMGVVPSFLAQPFFTSIDQIPLATGTATIAALANVTNGTAMTLVSTISNSNNTPNVPIQTNFSGANAMLNGGSVVNVFALDYGFAFGTCVASNAQITVADSTQFEVGMPLCIGFVGNAAGTAALLTNVASIVDATHITVDPNNVPVRASPTGGAPIGTGNIWGSSENGFPTPTAALPFLAKGPSLFLDPQQAVARAVSITGVSGGAGGAFLVSGADVFGQAMSETITVGSGATTATGNKAFKYIISVVPQFTDAHNYSVGTGDKFGFHLRVDRMDQYEVFFNSLPNLDGVGFTAAVTTTPATSSTGDVRGTIASASLTTIGAASNGTVSGLALSGKRMVMLSRPSLRNQIWATPLNPQWMLGVTQA